MKIRSIYDQKTESFIYQLEIPASVNFCDELSAEEMAGALMKAADLFLRNMQIKNAEREWEKLGIEFGD